VSAERTIAILRNLDLVIVGLLSEVLMTEPDYARSSATEVMQIVLVVSPILLRKKRSCGVIYSQLIVREECLAKGIPCVKLAVCVAINPDLHLQAQVRTRHNKQKQKRANPGPYLYFSQPAQRFRKVEGGSNVSRS
jgi:hypothetical protein